jgi:diadenylate cyclase
MDRILSIFQSVGKEDTVDILTVSLIFYLIFVLLKESRSFTALRGLVAVIAFGVVLWVISRVAQLTATARLLEESLTLIVIVFVVLFQNELKKALTDFGQTSIFRPFLQGESFEIDEIIKAVVRMSERKIGALIAIERRNNLRPYIEVGTQLDAVVSAELLRTIFALQTPLHDGAVIIRNNRVAAAGCLLPLSESPRLSKDLGTRHRAGIGLTEETDAVTIICSEETGQISIAHDGKIERNENAETLRNKLRVLFEYQEDADG